MKWVVLVAAISALVVVPTAANADVITTFQGAMQPGTTAAGWSYLWNSGGTVGDPTHYTPLVATTDPYLFYDKDGVAALPRPDPGAYVYLGLISPIYPDLSGYFGRPGGHPGLGSEQAGSGGIERYAIAAYTMPVGGPTQITSGQLINADISEDGLSLRVYLNNNPVPLLDLVTAAGTKGAALPFGVDLGVLSPGDTVYVAVGSRGNHTRDSFVLEYGISVTPPENVPTVPEPGTPALLGLGIVVLFGWRRRRQAGA